MTDVMATALPPRYGACMPATNYAKWRINDLGGERGVKYLFFDTPTRDVINTLALQELEGRRVRVWRVCPELPYRAVGDFCVG